MVRNAYPSCSADPLEVPDHAITPPRTDEQRIATLREVTPESAAVRKGVELVPLLGSARFTSTGELQRPSGSRSVAPPLIFGHRICTVGHSCDLPRTRTSQNLRPTPAVPVYTPYPSPFLSKYTDEAQQPSVAFPPAMSVSRTSTPNLSTVSAPSQQEQEAPNTFFKCESVTAISSTSNENRSQQRISRSIAIARPGLSTYYLPPAIVSSTSTPTPISQGQVRSPGYIRPASRRVTPMTKVDKATKRIGRERWQGLWPGLPLDGLAEVDRGRRMTFKQML